ncbi:MAG: SGNH/GDSL hydrolase family protein [Bryobacterales bacterium]|nr:SGNH/GDSL hydrolase family protein [Bryobacterales bacterium]
MFLTWILAATVFAPIAAQTGQTTEAPARWHNLASMPLEGQGWTATKHRYDRLPAKAEGVVRAPVWSLAQDSAGMSYRFVTDAATIRARWRVRRPRLSLVHMPATGVSGLDLYVRNGGKWQWIGVGRPDQVDSEQTLVSGITRQKREYLLYLPLYNGVEQVEVGVPEGSAFEAAPTAGKKPVVFYGTSILQGGCASRPGMAYPAIVSRMLDWPAINLGFSGNGKTEPEMADLLAELDPAVYVMDSLPNLSPDEARDRVGPFVAKLRAAHPKTPIVLVENVTYTDSHTVDARRAKAIEANRHLKTLYEKLKASGDTAVYYIPTQSLFGADGEDTVDGVHPTDLGFLRMAQGIAPVLRPLLK